MNETQDTLTDEARFGRRLGTDIIEEIDIDTSYEPFSREPEYIDANRAFIERIPAGPNQSILDLACGTGTMTDLLLEHLSRTDKSDAAVRQAVGLDLSKESLLLGLRYLSGRGFRMQNESGGNGAKTPSILLLEGSADTLPIADQSVDLVVMGNAIQLVDRLDDMLAEIYRVLRPGGRFGFNTSFYAGTYVPGTEHVYVRWMQESIAYIRQRDEALRAAGEAGVPRSKGKAARAFSKPWLAVADYASRIEAQGLQIVMTHEHTVLLTQRCFETIGAYAGLAKVLLSGYPIRLACEALVAGAGPTLDAVGMREVPRYWLEVVAIKPQAAA